MSRLNLWIRVLIKRHIQELNVIIYTTKFLFLPLDLFTCKTLVVLTLGIMLRLSVPSSISFPVLKTLNVSLALPNNTLTQTLFCNCPKLEDLFIEGYVLDSERVNVNISAPVLKTLVIEWYCWYRYRDCYIVVNTPILEHLSIRDNFLAHYDLCILPLLIKADFNVGDCYIEAVGGTKELADRARVPVEKFSQVKFLSLGASSMKALHYADDFEWPLFPNLTHLELVVHNCYVRKQLFVLLNNVPNLATLVLTKDSQEEEEEEEEEDDGGGGGGGDDDDDDDDGDDDEYFENFEFIGTQGAPASFFSHLREIRISWIG